MNISRGPDRRPWRFDLALDPAAAVPRQTQLARALVAEIQRGRLAPGAFLPGSRTLAAQVGVNRKVVVAAVDELVAQGWLEALPARGIRVAMNLPRSPVGDVQSRREEAPRIVEREPALLRIGDGVPDARIAPVDALARAQRRALRAHVRAAGQGYGDPAGDPVLREVLAGFVNQARGLSCSRDEVVLTHGSQGALSLFALALLKPGDVVAVEHPGYAPAWRAFELAGAAVVHVEVDAHGLRTDLLEAAARKLRGRLKAVYVTPHHQYPTTVALAPERRMHLRRICEQYGAVIVEDDYDYEYHFDGTPLLPLSATAAPDGPPFVYVASLSKLLAPAVRLGYVIAAPAIVARLRATRESLDRQGDVVLERAIAELIEDGELQRHARRARQLYAQRRDLLLQRFAASPTLAASFACERPSGGLALWVRMNSPAAVDQLVTRARRENLVLAPGSVHLARGEVAAFRFGFAAHTPEELTAICELLERCLSRRLQKGR
ncbi:PLP-dependent aminotransferase family protein [Nannocystis sp. RBIL2]|uniref:aminotransferase-like domain-containing protein n=1 Tax=Nannocystis sp. RBIL2 TaxID=2996788 RepID=UPI00226E2240|nr:PLP-dependent aminotransferase family protein [Nannocystis sp. RBIL2]MCY1071402.1 PLP-dependent aminotransferase family protein [Nannocystis sp. RBIL2]